MRDDLINLGFLLGRYLHIIAATMIVGGTLFYELIVPVAIDDLRDAQKLSVFARARWAFRWIVWIGALTLLGSGVASSYRNWPRYTSADQEISDTGEIVQQNQVQLHGAGYWWLAHAIGGTIGMAIAV